MTSRKYLIGAAALFLTSGLAQAANQTPVPDAKQKAFVDDAFAKVDINHDGHIDRAEWSTFIQTFIKNQNVELEKQFAAADINHDGKLTKSESTQANPVLGQNFEKIDVNKDGFLTLEEIRASISKMQK